MVTASPNEELEKNPKRRLLEILRILASFYSFRKLEERLGVPMQTLWKYYALKTVPEKETAIKVLHRIEETGLLEEIVGQIFVETTDPVSLVGKRGVLELAAYKASEIARRGGVAAVLSLPDAYSAAVAFSTAVHARSAVCLSDQMYIGPDSVCTILRHGRLARALCVNRKCLAKKDRLMLVESIHVPGSIQEINSFLLRHRSHLTAVFILYGDPEMVEEDQKRSEEKPYTEILIKARKAPSTK